MNIVKESLAKLLAQEDLIVEHRQVSTAQFNVETRVLTLPTWSHKENAVVDALIAHEVGHALYTPNEWDFIKEIPMQFVNVVEDIRIEMQMKRRYPGLSKTFYKGYQILSDEDFFKIEGEDISEFNIADRLNLWWKIGNYIDVPFTDDEKVFTEEARKLETFEDPPALARKIFAYATVELEQQKKEEDLLDANNPFEDLSEGRSEKGDGAEGQHPLFDDEQSQKGNSQEQLENEGLDYDDQTVGQGNQKETTGTGEAGRNETNEFAPNVPQVRTADDLESALRELVEFQGEENVYVEFPKSFNAKCIVSNDEVSNLLNKHYTNAENPSGVGDEYQLQMQTYLQQRLKNVDADFKKFKISMQKEVNYLVKEFEMKKAADGYARATVSRTGVLDTSKLHTYKYNEDLFRKVTTIPDGKSHGLVFNVDWSGSMGNCIKDTMKQVFTLVTFCRKVGIAYDVYLFSDSYSYEQENYRIEENFEHKNRLILKNFSMVNVLSSGCNNRKHDRQMLNLFRLVSAMRNYDSCGFPRELGMGGTPLNEAMVAMNHILPEFQKRTGVQKMHLINLTDGEGFAIPYGREVKRYYEEGTMITKGNIKSNVHLRDRKTSKVYQFSNDQYNQTDTFIYQLRDRFPQCEFMNIRLVSGNEWYRFKRACLGYDEEKIAAADAVWKKTKAFICTSSAYTVQYALHAKALDNETEFEVAEDATKAQIKRAFAKSLGGKKMNKKILTSFIERIA